MFIQSNMGIHVVLKNFLWDSKQRPSGKPPEALTATPHHPQRGSNNRLKTQVMSSGIFFLGEFRLLPPT